MKFFQRTTSSSSKREPSFWISTFSRRKDPLKLEVSCSILKVIVFLQEALRLTSNVLFKRVLSFSKRNYFFPSLAIQILTFWCLFYWHLYVSHFVDWNRLYYFTIFLLQPLLFLYLFIQISTFPFLEDTKGSSWGSEHIYIYIIQYH